MSNAEHGMEPDHRILRRMLSDAERLCRTQDALLAGQYDHLRGRIAALIDIVSPHDGAQP